MRQQTEIDKLSRKEREEVIERLLKRQGWKSYISGKTIDLSLNKVEIDHIVALDKKGLDDESNWGVVIDTENSSKGKRDLQLLRYIYFFRQHSEKYLKSKRDFNLGDAIQEFYPNRKSCKIKYNEDRTIITLTFQESKGIFNEIQFHILEDSVDKSIKSFVGMIPFSLINHDSTINPRSIVDLEQMIEEFYNNNPQLFPSLGILETDVNNEGEILVFDGQHKAAAQLYLRSQKLFLRVFINADKTKIKKTNLRAHTVVAQIHFPQLVTDKVGHDLFKVEYEPFLDKIDWEKESELSFIKQEEINDEYRNYLQNYYRYKALIDEDGERHKILEYVETISARSKKLPLSYDTLSKTFLKFIFTKPSDSKFKNSVQLRRMETENLKNIMNIFVDEVIENKFDIERGIFKLEEKLEEDADSIPDAHLIAYRMCRQSALIIWIEELKKAISLLLKSRSKYSDNKWGESNILWAEFTENELIDIRNMIKVIRMHSIWRTKDNKEILSALGSTKQTDWKEMLVNGKLPGRQDRLFDPLNDSKIFNSAINMKK